MNQCTTFDVMKNRPVTINYKSWPTTTHSLQGIHVDHGDWFGQKLLVCTGSFSKHITAWVLRSTRTKDACTKRENIFQLYGYPKTLVTDN